MASMSILQSLPRQLKSQSRGEQFRAHQGQQQANHLRINATIVNSLTGRSKVRSAGLDFHRLPFA
jgi:hypothetical protein